MSESTFALSFDPRGMSCIANSCAICSSKDPTASRPRGGGYSRGTCQCNRAREMVVDGRRSGPPPSSQLKPSSAFHKDDGARGWHDL